MYVQSPCLGCVVLCVLAAGTGQSRIWHCWGYLPIIAELHGELHNVLDLLDRTMATRFPGIVLQLVGLFCLQSGLCGSCKLF